MNFLIESVFIGFAFYCVLFLCLSAVKSLNNNRALNEFDSAATYVLRSAGLLYTVLMLIYIFSVFNPALDETNKFTLINRMFGPYWFGFWIPPITYLLASQLMWFKKVNKSKLRKLVLGLLIVFFWKINEIIIIITSYHHDFQQSIWNIYSPFNIFEVFLDLAIFLSITAIIQFNRTKRSLKFNNN
ncbi:MAG: hypothetical protein ACXWEY_00675 [Bacteroidia bacterium]